MILFKNDKVRVEYNEKDRDIFAMDLLDQMNQSAIVSRRKRGLKKAVEHIQTKTNQDTTFSDISDIMDLYNLSPHHWCMMD